MKNSHTKLLIIASLTLASCVTMACDKGDTPASAQGQDTIGEGGTGGAGTEGRSSTGGSSGKTSGRGGSDAAGASGASGTNGGGPNGVGGATAGANQGGSAGTNDTPPSPSCAKGGFYDFSAKALDDVETVPMCNFAGKVVMVVNVASKCGYTPQYKPLQTLFTKYADQGFVVLGFPSADFGNQEFADDKDISAFCTGTYGITFPMFSRIDVKGTNQHPLYTWLIHQPGGEGEITWNFNKFLLGRDGVFRERFATETSPDSVAIATSVEAALAAPTP